ncbi:MAG: 3-oxoacyl-[acyl-carrier-protein] reductase [Kiritimatiellae bacterium]|nr:3-oxoacyl-[acyl-carrier-protein] reductase [Kiritimatiellia bacterium]MBP5226423.1 3-oxoacyl-[acyl-carrier-protein] reductase [Kiritimatiellia bacterium]
MGAFDGKIAVVTGAARGIGQAIALKLASGGADVAVCDLQVEWLDETVKAVEALGRKALPLAVDVGNGEAVNACIDAVIKAFGRIDIMINNAGITKDTLLIRMSEEQWDDVLRVNLKGVFLFSRAVAKPMMRQRSGAIVNIASIVGLIGGAGQCNYSASKAGVIALTKSTAKELASRGVRANAVAPGFIKSKMTDALPEEVRSNYLGLIPMARFGETEDIAKAVAFLASDEASYITGQVLSVNGGMVM